MLGDPVLRQVAEEVVDFDDELKTLAENMFETMYGSEGIGLAAPQVGVSRRLFVMDVRDPEIEPRAVVNPTIVECAGSEREEEGCLSIPGIVGEVQRSARIVIEAADLEGRPIRIEASDLLARCIQHEIDHIDGILFIDRLSAFKRKLLLNKWKKLQREKAAR